MNSHSLTYTVKTKRGEARLEKYYGPQPEPFGLNKSTRREKKVGR